MSHNKKSEPHASNQSMLDHLEPREHAALLISRYPSIEPVERAQLVDVYKQLSPVDVALLLSDDALREHLDRFTADHRETLRSPFRHYAILVMIAVLAFATIIWTILHGG